VDKQETLWLYSTCGLIAIDNRELQRWWADPKAKLQYSIFDSFDGVQAAQTSFTPRASEAPDGKLWFANGTVAQVIDPKNIPRNALAPPVHIENLIVDGKSYSPRQALRLPPLGRDLEIDYTALSLAVPQKVQFRYRLEGRDKDWQDPGTRRQAFYSDLSPGRYQFRVMASNNDGVWNSSGASLEFAIEPALYQTWWLRTAALVATLAIIAWVIRRRMGVVAANIQARLVERLDERERIARELHDTLLQGILSASLQLEVADRQIAADATAKPLVQRISNLLRQLADESRHTVRHLRSQRSQEENLERALTQISSDLAAPRNVKYSVVVEGTPRSLRAVVRDEIFRIGGEALANVFRHADASAVETVLEYGRDHFRLLVRDDGQGIDPEVLSAGREGHFGLSGMRERARRIGAQLKIRTAKGAGTEIDLIVPSSAAFERPDPHGPVYWIARLYSRVKRS
jgi:signal transduction histidine kinase